MDALGGRGDGPGDISHQNKNSEDPRLRSDLRVSSSALVDSLVRRLPCMGKMIGFEVWYVCDGQGSD